MAKEIDAIIKALQDKTTALGGVQRAPDYVPGTAPDGIFAIAMPGTGRFVKGAGGRREGHHVARVFIGKAYKNLADDEERLLPYGDSFANALIADPQLGNTVETVGEIRYDFVTDFDYGGIQHVGWTFEIEIKKITA